ncbi:D-serine deaminase-like pyridoxal phosphate-dependent protein [Chitinophaga skermanii]|uniref:D-serine deaminase-like pyridoxal phosphate-dependent protein n=1 Tax=Chitinophaga skermanii TaxID=331697 RepID=A0A327QKS6_9BACT|nr:D-TA family PLP-dependent enzyme [Chitinophaga skermanii]RAJ04314.1 D-serine deaminase-like pyridoxal phosphate-dependent protein [Chitinophaga skermanii]
MDTGNWYEFQVPADIDSPALLIYKDRVAQNIDTMISIAGDPAKLMPHVKTHKLKEIVQMQLDKGITRFKCATIAEAEMVADAGAAFVLLAYQVIGPKLNRWLSLVQAYPKVQFASVVDNEPAAQALNNTFAATGLTAQVYIDIDNGMHRTGINPTDAFTLYEQIAQLKHLRLLGLHVYDGHIREVDFDKRTAITNEAYAPVASLVQQIINAHYPTPGIVVGGTPTFTVHAKRPGVICSPGTCLLWDEGYGSSLPEQPFLKAAVLFTRVISQPIAGRVTTDLGHKAVAAENTIDKRVAFLNLADYKVISQSEEHLVVETATPLPIGALLFAVPFHVCPSVALYNEAHIIEHGQYTGTWRITARQRKINI